MAVEVIGRIELTQEPINEVMIKSRLGGFTYQRETYRSDQKAI